MGGKYMNLNLSVKFRWSRLGRYLGGKLGDS
jgi:hypothetical protein